MFNKLKKEQFSYSKVKKKFFIIFILWSPGVTFFLLIISLILRFSKKQEVNIIFDKSKLSERYFSSSKVNLIIYIAAEYILKILFYRIYNSDKKHENIIKKVDENLIEKYFLNILSWKKSKNFDKSENLSPEDIKLKKNFYKANKTIYSLLTKIKKENNLQKYSYIIPGGIASTSRLWISNIKTFKDDFYTFENGGKDKSLWAINGIAAQFPNVMDDHKLMLKSNEKIIKLGIDTADRILRSRYFCKDIVETGLKNSTFQKVSSNKFNIYNFKDKIIVTIFLNVSWDSAVLGIESIFNNSFEMIENISNSLLKKENIIIYVRQHPIERDPEISSNDNYELLEKILKKKYKERFIFINADQNLNSYDLIEKSDLIIVNSSTIGLEAAILGKPVFTCSKCYYHKLKLINYFDNISILENYLVKIERNLINKSNQKSIDSCKLLYFLTQSAYRKDTGFSPGMNIKRFFTLLVKPNTLKRMNRNLNFLLSQKLIDFDNYKI